MRLLGKQDNQEYARLAQGLLLSRQIGCRIEQTASGWEIWALEEHQMLEARTLYQQFADDENKELYQKLVAPAQELLARFAAERERGGGRRSAPTVAIVATDAGTPLSWFLIMVCIALWVMQTLVPDFFTALCYALQIAPDGARNLNAVFSGQIWRLITPTLLHAPLILPDGGFSFMGLLHITFNMMWMKDLAPLIERRHSTLYLFGLFLVVAIGSNLTQFFLAGPNFLGMSGVVYGLLGFLWIRSKVDKRYGLTLNPSVVYFMLLWLVFCMLGNGVANGAHWGGIILGAAWGFISGSLAEKR